MSGGCLPLPSGEDGIARVLGDAVADGRITVADADAVQTFAAYLRELKTRDADPMKWRRRWGAYASGLADGPTTDEEYAEVVARRIAERRAKP